MTRLICSRLLAGLVTVLVSTMVIFAMVRFIPGDPISALLADGGLSPEAQASLERTFGLDRSVPAQYWSWLTSVLHGDFGVSLVTQQPLIDDVLSRIPRTLYLAMAALGIALVIAVPLAIVSARFKGRRIDSLTSAGSSVLVASPAFVIGTLLIAVFSVYWNLLPVAGYAPPSEGLGEFFKTLLMPALALGLPAAAVMTRVLRAGLLDQMNEDYLRSSVAQGASLSYAITHHALRNAALPAVTIIGLQLGYLLGGAVVVELLFSYPGLGLLLLNSITQRNYPVIQACLLFYAIAFVVVNLVTDIVCLVLNPRLRAVSA